MRVYPGECKKCGKWWGDHMTDYAIKHTHPHACVFEPLDGEIVIETDMTDMEYKEYCST